MKKLRITVDGKAIDGCVIPYVKGKETYDVVGPICESSDVFVKAFDLNRCHRGDLLALRSAGAYGEIMASRYNCRELPVGYTTEDFV